MNMHAKKRVNGSWVDAPYYIHKTAAATFTTLPVDVYADSNNATVGLKVNTVQNGTPTPENPVEVVGVGDRTANLYLWNGNLIGSSGLTVSENKSVISSVVDVRGINTVYFTGDETLLNSNTYRISKSDTPIEVGSTVKTFDSSFVGGVYDVSDCNYLLVTASVYNKPQENIEIIKNTFMLNSGSTALPYEPYGYKIPISSANTTTPVYLGEAQTTRRVRKLVLTGKETWYLYSTNVVHQFYTQGMVIGGVALSAAYSTITPYGMTANNRNGDYGCYTVTSGNEIAFQMYGSMVDIPTQTEWKAYLAAQYSAGTPVTVWYVLATPETGIVNEPLMKIGNYADEVSNISIPTITGKNIVDVETVLKPSEVSFNYAGWHTAVVHKRINGAWD